jgi:protein dithiol oxidoreductase (disulfide-forming)
MRIIAVLLQYLSPLLLSLGMSISVYAMPVAGKDYVAISPPQPTETGGKIEVVEVFSYMCPHCYEFEPKLEPWLKALPADVAFRRLPVSFGRESWANLAKTYYTLEVLGQTKLSNKVFDAIHAQNMKLDDPNTLFDWAAKQGLDRKAFADAFNSFGVQAKMQRSAQLARAYGVDGVPALIVDGKFRVSAGQDMLRIADELIQLARAQRPKASAERGDVSTAGK